MMDIAVRRAARAAARRLADLVSDSDSDSGPGSGSGSGFGPDLDLRTQVETALQDLDADARPQQYTDPVALGSLIVSAAGLAWGIYKDLREKSEKTDKAPKPAANVIITQVELKLPASDPVPPAYRTRIIEVVVEEVLDNDNGNDSSSTRHRNIGPPS